MEYLEIKNWHEFQHYSDRNPPWIKLHFKILTSHDWIMSTDKDRLAMVACCLIGSRHDGRVPNDPDYLKKVCFLDKAPDLKRLVELGFLVDASTMQADAIQMKANDTRSVSSYTKERVSKNENEVVEVMAYLNEVTGRRYTNDSEVRACFRRDHPTVEDAKAVIAHKWAEWRGTELEKHVNPVTPFRKKHFKNYLDQANASKCKHGLAKELPKL